MRTIGIVTRLQIQRDSLKRGEKPTRVYDPTPLLAIPALHVTPDGALGGTADGTWSVDVHHRDHPYTKNADGLHDALPIYPISTTTRCASTSATAWRSD